SAEFPEGEHPGDPIRQALADAGVWTNPEQEGNRRRGGILEFFARSVMRTGGSVAAVLTGALLSGAAAFVFAQSLPVTYERLLKAGQEPGNWLTYSNTYSSWRYSRLDQINTQNVKNLHVKWLF